MEKMFTFIMVILVSFLIFIIGNIVGSCMSAKDVSNFLSNNRYGIVIEKNIVADIKMVRRGFAPDIKHIVMLRGVDTGVEQSIEVLLTQYENIEVSDTISLNELHYVY